MPKKQPSVPRDDPRFALAASIWRKSPMLELSQAMRAARFSARESDTKSLQLCVNRRVPNIRTLRQVSRKQSADINALPEAEPNVIAPSIENPIPRQNLKRKLGQAAQEERALKKAISDYRDRAHERATTWYAEEKKKPNGMSARQVREQMLKTWEWAPAVRSIQRYVNDYKLVGTPRMHQGPRESFPHSFSRH